MVRLLVVRHGVVHNPDRVLYGRLPGFPLSARGRGQIARLAERAESLGVREILCSPIARARESAQILAKRWQAAVIADERLMETDMGAYQGRPFDELWSSRHVKAPGTDPEVESFDAMRARVGALFDELQRTRDADAVIACVGHRDPLALGLMARFHVPEARLYRFRFEPGDAYLLDLAHPDPTPRILDASGVEPPETPRAPRTCPPFVQIAGVSSREEAWHAAHAGVHALGFTLGLPEGLHDGLDEARAKAIIAALPPFVTPVLITYLPPEAAAALARRIGAATLQLHGEVAPAQVAALRSGHEALKIIARVSVTGIEAVEEALGWEQCADAIILDSVHPETGKLGATGVTHDWAISASIVRRVRLPVILAGGLNADNVAAAVRQVRPFAVDVHTGVENPDGSRDYARITRFAAAARAALEPPHE